MIKSHLKVFFLKKKIYYNRNKKEKKVERKSYEKLRGLFFIDPTLLFTRVGKIRIKNNI